MPSATARKLKAHPNSLKQLTETEIPWLHTVDMNTALRWYDECIHHEDWTHDLTAELGRYDRFFLLTHILSRVDAIHPWLYERCREVEADTDGMLDLWSREHYKSTIITFAGSVQEVLKDPNITIGIFSHTRPISTAFLRQIKLEFETNELLKQLYPDIFWQNPHKEAFLWSEEKGITVKRTANPKEATVEAWGLVDGQPTSKHFKLRIYNDVVTRESVTTGDQIVKTTEAWELSQNLASTGEKTGRQWHEGTRYHFADTYAAILNKNVIKLRCYPATDTGTPDGKPVFWSPEVWEEKKKLNGPYNTACQLLLNPIAGSEQDLKPEWIRTWEIRPFTLNVYILCDPADSKAKGSSNTAMAVIGLDTAHNKYLLDGACHKMNLRERWEMLKTFHKRWTAEPGIQGVYVGYEKYGMQSDIQHFEQMMEIEGYYFPLEEVSWTHDDTRAKDDRIKRLVPDLSSWRFFFPYEGEETKRQREARERGQEYLVSKPIRKINQDKKLYNLVQWVLANEYMLFPATTQKDFLDVMSRIYDMDQYVIPQLDNPDHTMPEATID